MFTNGILKSYVGDHYRSDLAEKKLNLRKIKRFKFFPEAAAICQRNKLYHREYTCINLKPP